MGSTTAAALVHELMEAGDDRRVGEAVQEPANEPFRPGGGQRHKVHILEMNGESYRLKDSRQAECRRASASVGPAGSRLASCQGRPRSRSRRDPSGILTPGQRTVAAALRVMGRNYARYHVLNRAVWSPRAAARIPAPAP